MSYNWKEERLSTMTESAARLCIKVIAANHGRYPMNEIELERRYVKQYGSLSAPCNADAAIDWLIAQAHG